MRMEGQMEHRTRLSRLWRARWAPVAAALILALVALVAFGGMNTANAASAAKHKTHTTHTTKKKPTPAPPAFALDITCDQGWTWGSGATAVVCVHTQPNATLGITVKACGKVVSDASLKGTVTANSSGDYSWSWSPSPTCTAIQATVKATSGGKSVTKTTAFTLQKVQVPSA